MATACVPNDDCDDTWIWPVAFSLALLYLLWYMYKNIIFHFLKLGVSTS